MNNSQGTWYSGAGLTLNNYQDSPLETYIGREGEQKVYIIHKQAFPFIESRYGNNAGWDSVQKRGCQFSVHHYNDEVYAEASDGVMIDGFAWRGEGRIPIYRMWAWESDNRMCDVTRNNGLKLERISFFGEWVRIEDEDCNVIYENYDNVMFYRIARSAYNGEDYFQKEKEVEGGEYGAKTILGFGVIRRDDGKSFFDYFRYSNGD